MDSHPASIQSGAAGRCQNPARIGWELEFPLRPRFIGREVYVGEWCCPGTLRPWWREHARYHELDLLRSGTHMREVGRRRQVLDPTIAALHAPDDEYWMCAPSERPQESTLILFRGALAEELAPRLARRAGPISPQAARLHLRLLRAPDPFAVEEAVVALIHRVVSDAHATPERPPAGSSVWRRLTEELQHVIAERYAERLTLDALATACGTSPFHASRVFRAVTGTTLHRQLTRVRLRAALFALDRAAGKLTDVALAVGFSSHSHFTRAFRHEFGCTPSSLAAP